MVRVATFAFTTKGPVEKTVSGIKGAKKLTSGNFIWALAPNSWMLSINHP